MITEAEMLDRFERVDRQREGDWLVTCPAHADRTPSLHLTLVADRWLLECKAGCATQDVLAAARLEWADVFVAKVNGRREVVAEYDYVDEAGALLFQVVRFAPKDFRQRRPDGHGGWTWKLGNTRRVLYRLPRVVEAIESGDTIYVVEGEKDVHALEARGLVATTNPAGAGKWKPEYTKTLAGANVVVVADLDEAGRGHAAGVARNLTGTAGSVRILEPAVGKDVADHLAAGKGIDDLLEPSLAKSTEHTEHSGTNPHGERNRGVRSGTDHQPNGDRTDPPALAYEPRILDRLDDATGALGLVGERHVARTVLLVHVSRLFRTPGRLVNKGDSSTGKSFAVECGLKTAAPEGLYVRTSTSPLALFYSDEDFRHRTLVFYEANKLGDDDDDLARVLRTLISEGRLAHEVTVPEKRSSTLLEKEGPVAFISTTCKATLDKEIETRILSLHSDNSDQMTRDVVHSILMDAADSPSEPDLSEWHELDRWLADDPREVLLPWAPALASFNLSGPPRLRRDISNMLSLARAHALLHRATREVDVHGRIVSTIDDYDVVRDLLATALAVATDKAVRVGTREIVNAVAALRAAGNEKVSMRAASTKAGRSTSTTHTDVHDALERGYLVNLSQRDDRFDLDLGDPLPGGEDLLPTTGDLARVFGQRSTAVRPATEHPKPGPGAGLRGSVRSVRSNPAVAGCAVHESPAKGCRYCARFAA